MKYDDLSEIRARKLKIARTRGYELYLELQKCDRSRLYAKNGFQDVTANSYRVWGDTGFIAPLMMKYPILKKKLKRAIQAKEQVP